MICFLFFLKFWIINIKNKKKINYFRILILVYVWVWFHTHGRVSIIVYYILIYFIYLVKPLVQAICIFLMDYNCHHMWLLSLSFFYFYSTISFSMFHLLFTKTWLDLMTSYHLNSNTVPSNNFINFLFMVTFELTSLIHDN